MALFSVSFHYASVISFGVFNDAELAERLIDALQDSESYEIQIFNAAGNSIWITDNDFLIGFIAGIYDHGGYKLRFLTAQLNRFELDNFRKGYFEARLMVE